MTCFKPIEGYLVKFIDETGCRKRRFVFSRGSIPASAFSVEHSQVPCGQCIGCRIDKSKEWALRCVHEASLWHDNCFITLTYNPEHYPVDGSLDYRDFQLFMKRLRKKFKGKDAQAKNGRVEFPIRFYACGEYGELLNRPHWHACLFNFDFDDKYLWSVNNGVCLYRSPSLEKLWSDEYGEPLGFCTIGDVTFESAAYVARYICKKITGEKAIDHYADPVTGVIRTPEFTRMSNREGIGRRWFETYYKDVYPSDFVTYKNKKFKPPRYYDNIYDTFDPQGLEEVKKRRAERAHASPDNTPERLEAREECQLARFRKLKRKIENES